MLQKPMLTALRKITISILYFFKYQKSYSQDGEDVVLQSFFENKKGYKGFYVDIGAHHPIRFSNTWFFYKKGWRGINIDPTPGSMKTFRWLRYRDINLEIGVASQKGEMVFFCFNEPALNTFDKQLAIVRNNQNPYYIIKQTQVPIMPLASILDLNLPKDQKIDFLTIDVEGLDLVVLQSNDWNKYSPDYILVEDYGFSITSLKESKIYTYLTSKSYTAVSILKRTTLYKKVKT